MATAAVGFDRGRRKNNVKVAWWWSWGYVVVAMREKER